MSQTPHAFAVVFLPTSSELTWTPEAPVVEIASKLLPLSPFPHLPFTSSFCCFPLAAAFPQSFPKFGFRTFNALNFSFFLLFMRKPSMGSSWRLSRRTMTLKLSLMAMTTWWTSWIYRFLPSGPAESTPTWRWGVLTSLIDLIDWIDWFLHFTKSFPHGATETGKITKLLLFVCVFRLKTGLGWWGMWFCMAVSGMICTLASRTASVETQMFTTTGAEKGSVVCLDVNLQ